MSLIVHGYPEPILCVSSKMSPPFLELLSSASCERGLIVYSSVQPWPIKKTMHQESKDSYGTLRAGCEGHQNTGCRCESMSGFKQPSGDAAGAATKSIHVRSYCSGCATMPATNHVLICDSDLERENASSDGRRESGPNDVICRLTMEVKGVLGCS